MKAIPSTSWKFTTTRFVTTVGAIIFIALLAFGYAQEQSKPPVPDATKPAEQVYKNIQTLKGVPSDQVVPAMQFITASLGVQCQFCHVDGHFDSDDKMPKQAARHMMEMMFAINKDNFRGHKEITCNTCHRGSVHPMAVPEITETAMAAESAAQQPPQNNPNAANDIIAKYVAALGGASALDKVTSRVQTGTSTFGGYSVPIEVDSKAPNKRVSIMKTANGESATAYDGSNGWMSSPGRPARDMSSSDIEGAKMDADLHFPTDIAKEFSDWRVLPAAKVEDRDVQVLRGRTPDHPPVMFYFDQQSGLLLRIVRYAETPLGNNPMQIDYSDYRDVDGVKVPFKWTVSRPGNHFTIQIDKTEQNVPVDDAKFAKPASAQ